MKIDGNELKLLVDSGLTDAKIGALLNTSKSCIHYYRTKVFKIERDSLRESKGIDLNHQQLEILFGCVLGDGYLRKGKYDKGTYFNCAHSLKQKEYLLYKASFFEGICNTKEHYRKIPNKKSGKLYSDITMYLKVNKYLNFMYEAFYSTGNKKIPIELLEEYYTPLAMAVHYCDDGSCSKSNLYNSYVVSIATCGFTHEDITSFIQFLLFKYNIHASTGKSNRVYIKSKSRKIFFNIIKTHIPPSMQYKLYDVS